MQTRFIVAVNDYAQYGFWGLGDTLAEAEEQCRKAAKRRIRKDVWNDRRAWRFTSELPFAPAGRDATEDEADAYIAGDGAVNWIRCEREKIDPAAVTA